MRSWGRLSRAFSLLGTLAGLCACVAEPGPYGYGYGRAPRFGTGQSGPLAPFAAPGQPALPERAPGQRVAILLPLTGANAPVGQSMLKAAQLAMAQPNSPPLDSQDTGGTPDGAARAARAALAAGAGILVGPLTAGETAAVAPIARAAGVPVLAFTSDTAQAQAGVWTMGITPAQQVRRLVRAVQGENRSRLAAIVPQNPFGEAVATGLLAGTSDAGLPPPQVLRSAPGGNGLTEDLKQLASAAGLHGPESSAETSPQPASIDALLLGASGEPLQRAVPTLAAYQTGPDHLRLLGTALWAREAPRLGALAGAWYAAPDPATRTAFEQQYAARFGGPPREFASLAFDAASVARAASSPAGFDPAALLRPDGYAGADGTFVLQPDGTLRRGLAVFEIDRTGSHIVQPAPQNLTEPGA
ncbi:MAG: penicillin-binding protein activator [Acetobacteraceae bacterium]